MNRALQSHAIVKSLLKVWNIEKEGLRKHATPHKMFEKEMSIVHFTKSAPEGDQNCVSRPENIEPSTTDLRKVEMSTSQMQQTPYSNGNFSVCNSITAGVLDSTVKQWVHMVCGLWTPGTRCPNVDTMSAFDVSGVSRPKVDTVSLLQKYLWSKCICSTNLPGFHQRPYFVVLNSPNLGDFGGETGIKYYVISSSNCL